MRRDIDDALQGWPSDPEPGEVMARELRARDGRPILQVRIELGLLQLEVEARPDGSQPHGYPTYLDYLRDRVASRRRRSGEDDAWRMNTDHCTEVDREFFQYYHRRVAWLSLKRYDRAVRDADHTLALMDFVARHGPDSEYVAHHEKYRGLVLFHRTQAAALCALDRRRPDEAIDEVRSGVQGLTQHRRGWLTEHEEEEVPNEALIEQLQRLENDIRKNFAVEKTLQEQLDEAVAHEDYERAASLRDMIRSKERTG